VLVFIGYTEKAVRKGKSLIGLPTAIDFLAENADLFGQGYHRKFSLTDTTHKMPSFTDELLQVPYYSFIQLPAPFFCANGGGRCYILLLGRYGERINKNETVDIANFPGTIFDQLAKTPDMTMVVSPGFWGNRNVCYSLSGKILHHCSDTQRRMGIFEVIPAADDKNNTDAFEAFKTGVVPVFAAFAACHCLTLDFHG